MAVTSAPELRDGTSGDVPTPVTWRGHLAALAAVVVALVALAVPGPTTVLLAAAVALAVGSGVSVLLQRHRVATGLPGALRVLAVLLLAVVATVVLAVLGVSLGDGRVYTAVVVLATAFALGTDWRGVERLRPLVLLSGIAVLPGFLLGGAGSLALTVSWLVAAGVALWALENDRRRCLPSPVPVVPPPAGASRAGSPRDLAVTVGAALVCALLLALFLPGSGVFSSLWSSAWSSLPWNAADRVEFDASTDGLPQPDAPPLDSLPLEQLGDVGGVVPRHWDELPGGYDWDGDARREQRFEPSDDGGRTVEGSDGRTFTAHGTARRGTVVDEDGSVVATYDADGFRALGGGGDDARYRIDDGELVIEGADGGEYTLRARDDGAGAGPTGATDPSAPGAGAFEVVDGAGRVVGRAEVRDDHLYVRDPDGRVLVPDPDGTSRVPIPDAAVRHDLLGQHRPGVKVRTDPDGTVHVSEPGGTTRSYDGRTGDGSVHLTVTDPAGRTTEYLYEYDARGGHLRVIERRLDGGDPTVYVYDPDGRLLDRPHAGGAVPAPAERDAARQPPGASDPTVGVGDAEGDDDEGAGWWSRWGTALLVAATVVALVAALLLWRRRRAITGEHVTGRDPVHVGWAVARLEELQRHAARRGRRRHAEETVLEFTASIAEEVFDDERVRDIGVVLSAALFGPRPPAPEERRRVESVLADLEDRADRGDPADLGVPEPVS